MNKIKLKKDYQIRHDMLIKKGAELEVSPNKALQLSRKGFCDFKGNAKKAVEDKVAKDNAPKEEAQLNVEHKITDK